MSIHEAIEALKRLFPESSVNIQVDLWSHVHNGKRSSELQPQWQLWVAEGQLRFKSEGATLETLIEMANLHVARSRAERETLDGARCSLQGL